MSAFPIPTARQTARGISLMLLAALLFSTMDAAVKQLVVDYPVVQVIWVRFAGQVVVVVAILRGGLLPAMRTRFPGLHLARSALQFTTAGLFFASLPHIGLAEAQALADINPVLITLGAALFLGERLGPRRLAGVLAAMIGAIIVIRPGSGVFSPAALLPILAAISYTGNALITRHVGRQESAWTSMIYGALFGSIASGVALPFVWVPVAASDIWLFALVGLLGSGAQLCVIRSFSIAEASVVAPFAYVGLVFATVWGIVLFADYPDLWTIIGALVIVAAGLYVWQREMQAARNAVQDGA